MLFSRVRIRVLADQKLDLLSVAVCTVLFQFVVIAHGLEGGGMDVVVGRNAERVAYWTLLETRTVVNVLLRSIISN